MKKLFLALIATCTLAFANISNKEIANMFILGFYGTSGAANTQIHNDICKGLGGVILFKNSPVAKGSAKNFTNASGLKKLIANLKNCSTKPLIAVDQEGGLVQRVKFTKAYPRAATVKQNGAAYARNVYMQMAKELKSLGFNLNFAPVADMAINPNNRVIVKYGRSYAKDAKNVIKYNKIFINAMHNFGIATSLKHFPGHGSSLGDTHKGFVDVTSLWSNKELAPYKSLKRTTETLMVAHIFNRNIDALYPASLSKKTVIGYLRAKIGFGGVVISDDLQMGAIARHYGLKNAIKLSINAGVDIMLFANQVSKNRVVTRAKVVSIVRELLNSGAVSEGMIKRANMRINALKERLY